MDPPHVSLERQGWSIRVSTGSLAALPLAAVAVSFEVTRLAVPLILANRLPDWASWGIQVGTLAPAFGICLWAWWRRKWILLAPIAGIVAAFVLNWVWLLLAGPWMRSGLHQFLAAWFPVALAYGPDRPFGSWSVVGPWLTVALFFLPILTFLVWWGAMPGSLVVLGGLGGLTIFYWLELPLTWLKAVAYLIPCLGLVALVATPSRWQIAAAWAILLADTALIALGRWYFITNVAPIEMSAQWWQSPTLTAVGVWGELPHAALTFSIALLLFTQWLAARLAGRESNSLPTD